MNRERTGWLFVAVQAALLVALVLVPTGTAWPVPGWLGALSSALILLGLAVAAVGSVALGRALRATPVPGARGELRTGGLYRWVRHPIYTGVLAMVAGLTVGTRQWLGLTLGVVTVAFFTVKARWEEARLAEAYPGYEEYAATTPRFVPRPRGRRPPG